MEWPEEIREKARRAFDSGMDEDMMEALKEILFYIGYTLPYDEAQEKKRNENSL